MVAKARMGARIAHASLRFQRPMEHVLRQAEVDGFRRDILVVGREDLTRGKVAELGLLGLNQSCGRLSREGSPTSGDGTPDLLACCGSSIELESVACCCPPMTAS